MGLLPRIFNEEEPPIPISQWKSILTMHVYQNPSILANGGPTGLMTRQNIIDLLNLGPGERTALDAIRDNLRLGTYTLHDMDAAIRLGYANRSSQAGGQYPRPGMVPTMTRQQVASFLGVSP